jgi:hypothetical protein
MRYVQKFESAQLDKDGAAAAEDDEVLPLDEGVLTDNLGIPIVIVVNKVCCPHSFLLEKEGASGKLERNVFFFLFSYYVFSRLHSSISPDVLIYFLSTRNAVAIDSRNWDILLPVPLCTPQSSVTLWASSRKIATSAMSILTLSSSS